MFNDFVVLDGWPVPSEGSKAHGGGFELVCQPRLRNV